MQFVKNFAAFFLVEGLDGIFHDADAESAAHQAVGGAEDAVFRNHAEHEKIGRRLTSASVGRQRLGTRRLRIDPREGRPGIWIVENIEGVLFQENLLEGAEIARKSKIALVWNDQHAGGARFGNQFRSGSALYAMRRPLLKFGIVRLVRI